MSFQSDVTSSQKETCSSSRAYSNPEIGSQLTCAGGIKGSRLQFAILAEEVVEEFARAPENASGERVRGENLTRRRIQSLASAFVE